MPIGGKPYTQPMSQPSGGGQMAYDLTPEELESLIAQGWMVTGEGSIAPPMQGAFTSPMPSAGRMDAPGPFASPVFSAYNAVANPAPVEKDPLKKLMRNPYKEPKPAMNLSVPGGASIQNGQPMAAPMPTPQEREDPAVPKKNPYGGRVGRRMAQRETMRQR